jgi:hypothetical protein
MNKESFDMFSIIYKRIISSKKIHIVFSQLWILFSFCFFECSVAPDFFYYPINLNRQTKSVKGFIAERYSKKMWQFIAFTSPGNVFERDIFTFSLFLLENSWNTKYCTVNNRIEREENGFTSPFFSCSYIH